jgi:predicted aspartyl protease
MSPEESAAALNVNQVVVAGLLGAILLNPGTISAKNHTNNTPEADSNLMPRNSIPVSVHNGYLPIVVGQIGAKKLNFIIDTGTAPSILNSRIAKKLQLPLTSTVLLSVGRQVRTDRTVLPELDLGPIHVDALPVNVMDLSQWEKNLGVEVGGLLGMDVLGRASFRLDYSQKVLAFGAMNDQEQGIPVQFNGSASLALADARLQGRNVRLIVDTGSDLVVVFGRTWEAPSLLSQPRAQEGTSVAEQVAARPIASPEIEIAGKQFHGPRTYYVPTANGTGYDGFFGVRALKLRGISFDRQTQTLFLLN